MGNGSSRLPGRAPLRPGLQRVDGAAVVGFLPPSWAGSIAARPATCRWGRGRWVPPAFLGGLHCGEGGFTCDGCLNDGSSRLPGRAPLRRGLPAHPGHASRWFLPPSWAGSIAARWRLPRTGRGRPVPPRLPGRAPLRRLVHPWWRLEPQPGSSRLPKRAPLRRAHVDGGQLAGDFRLVGSAQHRPVPEGEPASRRPC